MKRTLLTATAAFALAACGDSSPSPIEPGPPRFSSGQSWQIFTTQTPQEILSGSSAWEVATRFYTTVSGCITGFQFYRAPGETGANYVTLWTNSGTPLYSRKIADSYSGSGWQTIDVDPGVVGPPLDDEFCIPTGTYFRVSVNTNTKQAKTYAYLDNGPIVNGPLVADFSYYGQPAGSMPTQGSGSIYFVGVIFRED